MGSWESNPRPQHFILPAKQGSDHCKMRESGPVSSGAGQPDVDAGDETQVCGEVLRLARLAGRGRDEPIRYLFASWR